jgi:hypothetical protein
LGACFRKIANTAFDPIAVWPERRATFQDLLARRLSAIASIHSAVGNHPAVEKLLTIVYLNWLNAACAYQRVHLLISQVR